MMITTERSISASYFIEDWLINFKLPYEDNVVIPKASGKLDFLISGNRLGIMIYEDWKKPISVKVINKAFLAIDNIGVQKVYVVAKRISEIAASTIERLHYDVEIIHPYGLSDLVLDLLACKNTSVDTQKAEA